MRVLIFIALIIGGYSCTAQSEAEKKLLGKWILVAKSDSSMEEPVLLTINDSKSVSNSKEDLKTMLIFKANQRVYINQNGNEYNATYKLNDSILTLGNRKYIIVQLNKEKLIYKVKDHLFDKQYEYKKRNKQ
ncbi:hypothetical protein [Tenacibaculum aiptasiae]|uniref:hypothetical protein n=1 Tax=Tenacibaculum aiptasiae TaxID=426481 RepID=UPI003B58E6E9